MQNKTGTIYIDARTGLPAAIARVQDLRMVRPAVRRLRTIPARDGLSDGQDMPALEAVCPVGSSGRLRGPSRRSEERPWHAAVRTERGLHGDQR